MISIHFMFFTYVYTLLDFSYGAGAEVVPSAHMLPDGFFGLRNYEILGAYEEDGEDVVHIRKRVDDEDCETDCLNYSGWTEDRRMHCEAEETDPEEILDKRLLVKRGRKTSTCAKAQREPAAHG
jgi:hypothetical protein